MQNLTCVEEIEDFLEDQLLRELRAHHRSARAAQVFRLVDRCLAIVPYAVRRGIAFTLVLRKSYSLKSCLLNPWFWSLVLFLSVLSCGLLVSALVAFLPPGTLRSAIFLIAGVSVVGLAVMSVWCNAWRTISSAEAAAVQGFCSSSDRAQIVSGWVAMPGSLRACDAGFLLETQENRKRRLRKLMEQLQDKGLAVGRIDTPRWRARLSRRLSSIHESLYAGSSRAQEKVDHALKSGELGQHIERALLDRETPSTTQASRRPRL